MQKLLDIHYPVATRTDLQKEFGSWMQDKRTRRGLRQVELAKRVNIGRTFYQNDISMLERGVKPVDMEIIVGVCQALQVTSGEFNEMVQIFSQYL